MTAVMPAQALAEGPGDAASPGAATPASGAPPPAAASAAAPEDAAAPARPVAVGNRFAIGGGVVDVPGVVSVYSVQGALIFASADASRDARVGLLYFTSEDEHTKGQGAIAFLEANYWWGAYGLGYGSGLGQSSFTAKKPGGWDASSWQVAAYFSPVQLRFGTATRVEVSVDAGATRYFDPPSKKRDDNGVKPYGMFTVGVAF